MPHRDEPAELNEGKLPPTPSVEEGGLGTITVTPAQEEDVRPTVVLGPLGEMITVPKGGSAFDTMKQIEDFYNANPKELGEFIRQRQIQHTVDFDGNVINPGLLPSPRTRRAYLAAQGSFGLKSGGLDDLGVMFGLGRADLATEKLVILHQNYPDAEIELVRDLDGQPTILLRRAGEALGIEVEAPEFGPGDVAMLSSGIFSEDVLLELITFMATKTTGVKGAMMKAFAASTTGEGIKSLVERARGRELSTPGAITERMVWTGVGGAVGTGIFDRTARVRNLVRGAVAKRGLVTISNEAKRGQIASAELGLKAPLAGDLHPKWRNVERQAAATNRKLETDVNDRLGAAYDTLVKEAKEFGDVTTLSDKELRSILAKQQARINSAIEHPNSLVTWEEAGTGVQAGWAKVDELLGEVEGRAYVAAKTAASSAIYDIAPIKSLMAQLKFGIRGPITIKGKGWTLRTTVNVNPADNTKLKEAMNTLGLLDNDIKMVKVPGGTQDPLSTMIAVRSRFFNIMEDQAVSPTDRRIAAQIHNAMTEAMMHPTGVGPDGVKLWRKAAETTKFSENLTSKQYIKFISNSDKPEAVARYLANAGNTTAAADVKRWLIATGQRDKWEAVQDAFKNSLMDEPSAIRSTLTAKATRGTAGLEPVMGKVEQEAYLEIGDAITRMNKTKISQMLKEGTDEATRLIGLVETGSRREIVDFLAEVGGKETARGRRLAASVISSLANRSSKQGILRTVIDKNSFLRNLKTFRERGIMEDIFTEDGLRGIQRFEDAITFLPENLGVGDAMMTAALGSQTGGVLVGKFGSAFEGSRGFIKNDLLAWILMGKRTNRMIIGAGKAFPKRKPVSIKKAQTIGAVLGVVVDNMEEITETMEGITGFLDTRGIGSLETPEEFGANMGRIPR